MIGAPWRSPGEGRTDREGTRVHARPMGADTRPRDGARWHAPVGLGPFSSLEHDDGGGDGWMFEVCGEHR